MTGKLYIGAHKTKNLDDGYMGSGKYLTRAIEKHGIENFDKEILFVFDNADKMYAKEAEIVNEEFLTEENTYNLRIGGSGGFDYINSVGKNLYGKNGSLGYGRENLKDGAYHKERMISEGRWEEYCANMSRVIKAGYDDGSRQPSFLNKTHTTESKRKIGIASSIHQRGTGNSQFGTCWIYNSIESKKISKTSLSKYIKNGWTKGRKIKY